MSRFALLACFVFAACTEFPNLDDQVTDAARNAPFPQLTPIGPAPVVTTCADCAANALQARAAALRARAARLRNTAI